MSSKKLKKYMSLELPSIADQKKLPYKTDKKEIRRLFRLINATIFNNKLKIPEIIVFDTFRGKNYWGMCETTHDDPSINTKCAGVKIYLSNKWYCKQWLIDTLAHEMCHQYQWDVYSKQRAKKGCMPVMSHGPSFYKFRNKLARHNIALKRVHRQSIWFRHQNFFKC
jgi:hypothetical protein